MEQYFEDILDTIDTIKENVLFYQSIMKEQLNIIKRLKTEAKEKENFINPEDHDALMNAIDDLYWNSKDAPEEPKEVIQKPEIGYPKNRAERNMETASVTNMLPQLGLRPFKTTDWLVDLGILKRVKIEGEGYHRVRTIKVPTKTGEKLFYNNHNNALYITSEGWDFLEEHLFQNLIPADCLIKV